MITRAFDLPPTAGASRFSDVVAGSTHAAGINSLAAAGITSGFADGTFRPALNTPRAQTASFLYRAINTARDPSLGLDGEPCGGRRHPRRHHHDGCR